MLMRDSGRFWPGSGLVLRCLGPGFTFLPLGPGFRPIFIHSFIQSVIAILKYGANLL